jgi:HEAT repeat protein
MSLKLEDRIERLRHLRSAPSDAETVPTLRKALQDRANLVVAEASRAVLAHRLSSLIPDLVDAFDRLLIDPVKTDPKCFGKMAIVKALTELDYDQSPVFVRGSRHIQMEPVWGGREDAAPLLRGLCLLALVQCTDLRRFDILRHLVDALTDAEDPVRAEAVRAIAQLGGDEASLLLRLKARTGDRRPVVIGNVFDSLIELEADGGVRFVAEYLKSAALEIRDEASLSLGASRRVDAVRMLIETWNETLDHDFRGILSRALSSSRHEAAIEFLLNTVRTGSIRDSNVALEALQLLAESDDIQSRIAVAKEQRESPPFKEAPEGR